MQDKKIENAKAESPPAGAKISLKIKLKAETSFTHTRDEYIFRYYEDLKKNNNKKNI